MLIIIFQTQSQFFFKTTSKNPAVKFENVKESFTIFNNLIQWEGGKWKCRTSVFEGSS